MGASFVAAAPAGALPKLLVQRKVRSLKKDFSCAYHYRYYCYYYSYCNYYSYLIIVIITTITTIVTIIQAASTATGSLGLRFPLHQLTPDVVTYNSAMAACDRGQQWALSSVLLDRMG